MESLTYRCVCVCVLITVVIININGQGMRPQCNWCQIPMTTPPQFAWYSTEKDTWINAAAWCKLMGSQLLELSPQSQLMFKFSARLSMKKPSKHWVGMSDIEREGQFIWMQSGNISSIHLLSNDETKNCVNMDEHGNYFVDACTATNHFICQK